MSSHHLNQCWVIVNWALRNKLQWHFNQNTNLFIYENASENIICQTASILPMGRWVSSTPISEGLLQFRKSAPNRRFSPIIYWLIHHFLPDCHVWMQWWIEVGHGNFITWKEYWKLSEFWEIQRSQSLHNLNFQTHHGSVLCNIQMKKNIFLGMQYKVMFCKLVINSSPPSAVHMRQWIGSVLVQIMVCHLFTAKPSYKPMLGYC